MRAVHDLKCWGSFFREIVAGRKPFEVRINDRDYAVGDLLRLWEWSPNENAPTGVYVEVTVTSMLQGRCGLPSAVCVMGYDPMQAQHARGVDSRRASTIFGRPCASPERGA